MTTSISAEGLRLVKSFEGYGRRLPDGSCAAYQEKLRGGYDIPTIGYGCTEGITMGMVWTAQQAEDALRREIAKHEHAVIKAVTVDITQNQFDALVSFSYNCGAGNVRKLVKKLNAGDAMGTAHAFGLYTRAQGRVEPGLVSRRARETALFLKPDVKPADFHMPQSVDAARQPVSRPGIVVATGAATAVASNPQAVTDALPSLPAVPPVITETVNNASEWQMIGDTLWAFKSWALSQPLQAGCLILFVLAVAFWPRLFPAKSPEPQPSP